MCRAAPRGEEGSARGRGGRGLAGGRGAGLRGRGAGCGGRAGRAGGPHRLPGLRGRGAGCGARRRRRRARGAEPGGGRAMRRSSTDESAYRRSPSPERKRPGFARRGPFRRHSSPYARGGRGPGGGGPCSGLHAGAGPKAAQARCTAPQGAKYVVFYLDLSFIFFLELKRCGMARGCLQGVKYLMFAFNLLFWVSGGGAREPRVAPRPAVGAGSGRCPAGMGRDASAAGGGARAAAPGLDRPTRGVSGAAGSSRASTPPLAAAPCPRPSPAQTGWGPPWPLRLPWHRFQSWSVCRAGAAPLPRSPPSGPTGPQGGLPRGRGARRSGQQSRGGKGCGP